MFLIAKVYDPKLELNVWEENVECDICPEMLDFTRFCPERSGILVTGLEVTQKYKFYGFLSSCSDLYPTNTLAENRTKNDPSKIVSVHPFFCYTFFGIDSLLFYF